VVRTYKTFYTPETADQFDFKHYDYIVDAIDTVTGKIALVMNAKAAKTPIICSMGAGNKVDPTAFEVTDLYKTSVCPLAKVMRNELKKRGVRKLKVVYSKELPITPVDNMAISCRTHTAILLDAALRDLLPRAGCKTTHTSSNSVSVWHRGAARPARSRVACNTPRSYAQM
jgi:tRNA A37 threonylcarbamoyladenosine dehydratase